MTKVQKGDVVRLKYTGRIKETGEIFDTTEEEIAKQAGIYKENGVYGPVPIAVGAGHVIQGLDEQLEGLEVGKKYEIEVPPEKGFGKRDPKLIKTFTLGQFRRQGLIPFPGMPVEIETESGRKLRGRVLTVSGGRVRVDFNHPYAGKHLVYEVEIVERIEDPIEKVKALIELRLPKIDPNKVIIEIGEKDVVVDFTPVKDEVDKGTLVLGELLLEGDLKFLGYEEVKFRPSVDELLKPKEAEEGEAAEEEAGDEGATEQKEAAEESTEEKSEENVNAGESEEAKTEDVSEEAEEEKPEKNTGGEPSEEKDENKEE
jgi:FKBP-type peptidyl-prolyl cis-trans isomerase 2